MYLLVMLPGNFPAGNSREISHKSFPGNLSPFPGIPGKFQTKIPGKTPQFYPFLSSFSPKTEIFIETRG